MSFQASAIDVRLFPGDYAAARERWLVSLKQVVCRHSLFPCDGVGPQGEALYTDVAWLGKEQAEAVVVVIAGTHGVEGFTGSALQLDLLQRLTIQDLQLPEQTALLLIHALTPWGYAWRRRCDAEGVDLNRNVVDFTAALPKNADYEQLRPFLAEADPALRRQALLRFAEHHGQIALETAVSGGQYSDPWGPFYGGKAPAHGRQVCEALIEHYQLAQRRLAVLDLHTGLGPYGHGEIICDHLPDSPCAQTARRWYGDAVTLPLAGTSYSVPKLGLLDYLWHSVMNDHSCYVTLEFGTFGTETLFNVLLDDHRLWAQQAIQQQRIEQAQQMMRHFCPEDAVWRELVLFRGRQVIAQALRGVSA